MRMNWIIVAPLGLVMLASASLVIAQGGSDTTRRVEKSVLEGDIIELTSAEETLPPPQESVVEGTIKTPQADESVASAMLKMNNRYRTAVGRPPQQLSSQLTQMAQKRAEQVANTGLFPNSRMDKIGIHENVAVGQKSVGKVFEAWKNSSTHWSNMVTKDAAAGFGYAVGTNGASYWVALYGPAKGTGEVVRANFEQPVKKPAPTVKPIRPTTVTSPRPATVPPAKPKTAPEPTTRREERRSSRRSGDADEQSSGGILPRFGGRRRR